MMAVDGNWLLHRAYSTQHVRQEWIQPTVKMIVKQVYGYAIRLKATHIAFCFDGANNFRYSVYPEYKNGRSEDNANAVYSAIPALKEAVKSAGLCWLQHPNYEADDLLGSFGYQAECTTYLVCRDKDINQSLNDYAIKYTPAMGTQPEVFLKKTDVALGGMTVLASLDYQTLIGDAIDAIPQIVSPGAAKKILKEHITLKAYFATKEGRRFYAVNQQALMRNRKLVSLVRDLKLPPMERFVPKPNSHPSYIAWKNTKNKLF